MHGGSFITSPVGAPLGPLAGYGHSDPGLHGAGRPAHDLVFVVLVRVSE